MTPRYFGSQLGPEVPHRGEPDDRETGPNRCNRRIIQRIAGPLDRWMAAGLLLCLADCDSAVAQRRPRRPEDQRPEPGGGFTGGNNRAGDVEARIGCSRVVVGSANRKLQTNLGSPPALEGELNLFGLDFGAPTLHGRSPRRAWPLLKLRLPIGSLHRGHGAKLRAASLVWLGGRGACLRLHPIAGLTVFDQEEP